MGDVGTDVDRAGGDSDEEDAGGMTPVDWGAGASGSEAAITGFLPTLSASNITTEKKQKEIRDFLSEEKRSLTVISK